MADAVSGCWLNRVLVRKMCQALRVFLGWFERGTCPRGYGGRAQSALARLRNNVACGHVAVNAMRTLVAVSLMRAASLSYSSVR